MTVYAITDTKKGEQGLCLLIFKLPVNAFFIITQHYITLFSSQKAC